MRREGEYRATSNVPEKWQRWCERWRNTAVTAPSSGTGTWYRILQCGCWLKNTHPDIHSPADWSRDIALEYVAAVCQMKVGQWSEPRHMYLNRTGQLMTASARAGILQAIRVFFGTSWDGDSLPFGLILRELPVCLTLSGPVLVPLQESWLMIYGVSLSGPG